MLILLYYDSATRPTLDQAKHLHPGGQGQPLTHAITHLRAINFATYCTYTEHDEPSNNPHPLKHKPKSRQTWTNAMPLDRGGLVPFLVSSRTDMSPSTPPLFLKCSSIPFAVVEKASCPTKTMCGLARPAPAPSAPPPFLLFAGGAPGIAGAAPVPAPPMLVPAASPSLSRFLRSSSRRRSRRSLAVVPAAAAPAAVAVSVETGGGGGE